MNDTPMTEWGLALVLVGNIIAVAGVVDLAVGIIGAGALLIYYGGKK